MQHALGITPQDSATVTSSELCGTCHTVHLPIMQGKQELGHTYEQTTYPEWAFSAYRTGDDAGRQAAVRAPDRWRSPARVATCRTPMRGKKPFRSKIAGIQEHTNFPEVENGLPGNDIDLPVREGFARHIAGRVERVPDRHGLAVQRRAGDRDTGSDAGQHGSCRGARSPDAGAMYDQAANRTVDDRGDQRTSERRQRR